IPDTLRYAVAKDLADTFETSEKGKKLKEAQKKGPKEVQKLLEQEQADYIKNIREQYDFSRPEYKLQQGMQDPNILTRPDLQVFYKPETLEKIKKYKDKSTKENFTTAFESAIADLGQAIDSENIIQKATKQIARGVARNVAGPAVDLLQATELPKLDPATKTLVKDFLKQKGEVEMIQKAATETVTFPPDGDDKNKLKTDYHTPRIININILTGEGASVIGGNVPVNISTNKVDSKEIKNNIENVLNEGLDYVMSDLSSSILRVSKSTGMS
ncbi:MAG: hypothetical protein EBR27_13080, partial [Betaproteobacteria bacterium]|nr:hypothetical protein [Betaproteobacteria bacterium]